MQKNTRIGFTGQEMYVGLNTGKKTGEPCSSLHFALDISCAATSLSLWIDFLPVDILQQKRYNRCRVRYFLLYYSYFVWREINRS